VAGSVLAHTTTHISLLARLTEGQDQTAWAEFSERYEELIRSFARRRGLAAADQDDVVQDVMLALTKSMPGFEYDPAKGKFRSYLKTVVMRAISRRWCQNAAPGPLVQAESAAGVVPAADDAEETWEAEWRQYHLRTALREVRAQFNQTDLAAFDLYGRQGRSAPETAQTLGLSLDQVYQAKSRILSALSGVIARQVEEEG
jgi:RNA polymerase sigma-70 factor (ECF subfamily)